MNRSDQRKITKNLIALRKALHNDVAHIAEKLHDQKVFTSEMTKEILNVKPFHPQLQCGVLINKLLRSGKDAYGKFRSILEDLGHTELINKMEKSTNRAPVANRLAWTEDRGKTFVLPDPKVPERLNKTEEDEDELECDNSRCTESRIDEVYQLERMMTFVLSSLDAKDRHRNTVDFKKDFKQKLKEESNGNEELMGFFNSLRYNSFSLTSQSLAH